MMDKVRDEDKGCSRMEACEEGKGGKGRKCRDEWMEKAADGGIQGE